MSQGRGARVAPSTGNLWIGGLSERYKHFVREVQTLWIPTTFTLYFGLNYKVVARIVALYVVTLLVGELAFQSFQQVELRGLLARCQNIFLMMFVFSFNQFKMKQCLLQKVIFGARAPKYWTPMAIMDEECKLMEVFQNINSPFLLI